MGRPNRPITQLERRLTMQAYKHYRVCADTLERLIERDHKIHIPHNRIHKILVDMELAKQLQKRVKRKLNWIRYQRRHSLTAVHIDWHFCAKERIWVFAVIDDASRKILALLECAARSTDSSIRGMELALKHGQIRQCISDHGAEFISNLGGKSKFAGFLARHGIKQILCKIKHPQSNGKVEKWFHLYDTHRWHFSTADKFVIWYNEVRPHRSLKFEILETPEMAFQRKMRAEV
jgi:transposase InsO family protein